MKTKFNELISEYPFYVGNICIIIGILYFIYKIYKKESFSMKDYNVGGWSALVNSWVLILILIVAGLFLILKY